jgi:hypothetical protein
MIEQIIVKNMSKRHCRCGADNDRSHLHAKAGQSNHTDDNPCHRAGQRHRDGGAGTFLKGLDQLVQIQAGLG